MTKRKAEDTSRRVVSVYEIQEAVLNMKGIMRAATTPEIVKLQIQSVINLIDKTLLEKQTLKQYQKEIEKKLKKVYSAKYRLKLNGGIEPEGDTEDEKMLAIIKANNKLCEERIKTMRDNFKVFKKQFIKDCEEKYKNKVN